MLKKPAYLSRFPLHLYHTSIITFVVYILERGWPGGHASASQERTDTALRRDTLFVTLLFFFQNLTSFS